MKMRVIIYAIAIVFGLSLWHHYEKLLSTKEGMLYNPENGKIYTVQLGVSPSDLFKWKYLFFLEEMSYRDVKRVAEEVGTLQEIISDNDPYVIDLNFLNEDLSNEEDFSNEYVFVSAAFLPDGKVGIDALLPDEWRRLEVDDSSDQSDIVGGYAILQKITLKVNENDLEHGEPRFVGPVLLFGPASSERLKNNCLYCFANECWKQCVVEGSGSRQKDRTNLKAWINRNSDWYEMIPEMTRYAHEVDKSIRSEGSIPIGSIAYFSEIDNKMRQKFPKFFEGER